ncbi:neurogenic locus protein delta-like isoform X2 [Oscarella lobularis]
MGIVKQIASLFLFWFVVAEDSEATGSGGAIVTSLVSYSDAARTLPSGDCCVGLMLNGSCVHSCHNVLHVCLINSEGHSSEIKCLSNYTTDEFETTWPGGVQNVAAPQKYVFKGTETSLSFSGPITDGLTLIINASNVDKSQKSTRIATFSYPFPKDTSLIDHGSWSNVELSFPRRTSVTFPSQWIDLKWKLVCNENYYVKCDVFCSPKDDDTNGHYACHPTTGDRVCCEGYEDPQTNCVKSKNPCLLDPCMKGESCSETSACVCPGDPPCDSTACKELKQCRTRPSYKCTPQHHDEERSFEIKKQPLDSGDYVGIGVGAAAAAAILIIFFIILWRIRGRSGYKPV